jgi:RNA polymerase sigma-70 factor (ECF subfamily)
MVQELGLGLDEARAAWPGVAIGDSEFQAFLEGKRAGAEGPLRVSDLYLACACLRGDAAAIAHFERRYAREIEAALKRFPALPITPDDVRQRLREKLFVRRPSPLERYAGKGDLGAWLRVVTVHLLLDIANRETRERPTEDGFFEAVVDARPSSEAAYLKQACKDEFREAFAAALARMPDREKSLLRYAFGDGRSIDEIGAIFRVHRATAARWVAKARELLVEETRADLMKRLQVDATDAESIMRAALSRMGTTLLRFEA